MRCWIAVILVFACSGTTFAQSTVIRKSDARLIVEDLGSMFSEEAIRRAKGILSEAKDSGNREVLVRTFPKLSDTDRKEYDKLKDRDSQSKFWKDWTSSRRWPGDEGVLVLICRSPGHIQVLTDRATRERGFSASNEEKLVSLIAERLKEARDKPEAEQQTARDKALLGVAEYSRDIIRSFPDRKK